MPTISEFKKDVQAAFRNFTPRTPINSPEGWETAWKSVAQSVLCSYGVWYHEPSEWDECKKMCDIASDISNVRRCSVCGKPMESGYYVDGDKACCDKCLLDIYHGDQAEVDKVLSHQSEDDADVFWGVWENGFYVK